MFSVKHNECVGFESRWKVKKVSTSASSQTTEFSQMEKGTSTNLTDDVQVQTDTSEASKLSEDVDMNKLASWLQNIYPRVKREIDDANNSHAFRGYRLQRDTGDVHCKLLQKIKVANSCGDSNMPRRVSAITWNITGKTLAFTCNFVHQSWCYHSGFVFVHTLLSNGNITNLPNKTIKVETCVVCLKFHPVRPNILAGSTFSGSVIIWNLQNEDGEEMVTSMNAHQEAVTHILWINDIRSDKGHALVTTSTDGLLKLWKYDDNALHLITRYKVKPPLLRNSHKNKESPTNILIKTSNGITCFDVSHHVSDMFVVGLEGGHIVQCSMLGTTELKGSTKEEPLEDPSFKYYQPHEGEVISISFSPNRKEMFMTYGTDAEIRIYLIGQEDPAQMIFLKSTLMDLCFVPYEDKLIAGCGLNGFMEIFHLQKAKPIKDLTKEPLNKVVSTCLAVNGVKNNIVTLGTTIGEIQLWDIPWNSLINK